MDNVRFGYAGGQSRLKKPIVAKTLCPQRRGVTRSWPGTPLFHIRAQCHSLAFCPDSVASRVATFQRNVTKKAIPWKGAMVVSRSWFFSEMVLFWIIYFSRWSLVIVSLEVREFVCMTWFYLVYIRSAYFLFQFLSTTFIIAIFCFVSLLVFYAYAQSGYPKIVPLIIYPQMGFLNQ